MDFNEPMFVYGDDEGNLIKVGLSDVDSFSSDTEAKSRYTHAYVPYVNSEGSLKYAVDGEDETEEWKKANDGYKEARVFRSGDVVAKKDTLDWLRNKYPDIDIENATDLNMAKLLLSVGRPDLVDHGVMVDLGRHDNVANAAVKGLGEGFVQGAKAEAAGALSSVGNMAGLLPGVSFDNKLTQAGAEIMKDVDKGFGTSVAYMAGKAAPHLLLTAATAGAGSAAAGTAGGAAGAAGSAAGAGSKLAQILAKAKMVADSGKVTLGQAAKLAIAPSVATAAETGARVFQQTGDDSAAQNAGYVAGAISYPINVVTGKVLPMGYDKIGTSVLKGAAIGGADAALNLAASDIAGANVSGDEYLAAAGVGAVLGGLIRGVNQSKTLKQMAKYAEEINALDDSTPGGIGLRAYPKGDGRWEVRRYRDMNFSDVPDGVPVRGELSGAAVDAPDSSVAVNPQAVDVGADVSTSVVVRPTSVPGVLATPSVAAIRPVSGAVRTFPVTDTSGSAIVGSGDIDAVVRPEELFRAIGAAKKDKSVSFSPLITFVKNSISKVRPSIAQDEDNLLDFTYNYLVNTLGFSEDRAALEMLEAYPTQFRGPYHTNNPEEKALIASQNAEWMRTARERLLDMRAYGRGESLPLTARVQAVQGLDALDVEGMSLVRVGNAGTDSRAVYIDLDNGGEVYYIDKTIPIDTGDLLQGIDASLVGNVTPSSEVVDTGIARADAIDAAVDNYSRGVDIDLTNAAEIAAQKQSLNGSTVVGGVSDVAPVESSAEELALAAARREEAEKAFKIFQRAMDGESVSETEMGELAKVVQNGVPVSAVHKELVGNPKMQWPIRGCVIKTPADVAGLTSMIRNPYQEMSKIIWLNDKGQVIDARVTALGVNDATYVNMHGSFENIPKGAKYFIHSHNHPSGVTVPSDADINSRKTLQRIGKEIGVEMLDDIITNGHSFYSFADNLRGGDKHWKQLSANNSDVNYPENQVRFDEQFKSEWEVAQLGTLVKYSDGNARNFATMLSTHNAEANWFVLVGNHSQVYGLVKAADTVAERMSQVAAFGVNRVIEIVGTNGDSLAEPTIAALENMVRYDVIRINKEGVAISAPLYGASVAQRRKMLSGFASEEVSPSFVSESMYASGEINHDAVSELTRVRGEAVARNMRGLAEGSPSVKAEPRLPATLFSLVEMSRYLSANGYPVKIAKSLRGGKLGAFKYKKSDANKYVPGSGQIVLDSSIFKIVPDVERAEIMESVKLSISQRVFSSEEMRQAAIIQEYSDALAKRTVENLAKNSPQARKVFAATIGSWLDVLPEMPVSRGNVFARLARLHHFSKRYFAPSGVELTSDEAKSIAEQVAAAYPLPKTLTPEQRNAVLSQRRNLRQTLKDDLMRSKGCLVVGDIKDEMKALVAWNLDVQECPARIADSSSELFNNAFSAWINYPGEVRVRAPGYSNLMEEVFAKDPEILKALTSLDDAISAEQQMLATKPASETFKKYGEMQEKVLQNKVSVADKIDAVSSVSMLQQLQSVVYKMESPLLNAMSYIPDIAARERAITGVYEFMRCAGIVREKGLRTYSQKVMQPLQLENISIEEFNGYLMFKRIGFDEVRMNVANVDGIDAGMARNLLDKCKVETPEKWAALERVDKLHRDWTREYFVEPLKQLGVYSDNMLEMIEKNVDTFVHFSIDQGGVGGEYAAAARSSYGFMLDPKIRKTKGSFDMMATITTADVAHKLAILSWATRNKYLYDMLEGLMVAQEHSPLLVRDVDKIAKKEVPVGGRPEILRSGPKSTIVVMHDGRLIGYDVPRAVEKFINPSDVDALEQLVVGGVVKANNVVKSMMTRFNFLWQISNFFRDTADSSILLPEAPNSKVFYVGNFKVNASLMKEVMRAWPHAFKRLQGELTPEFEEFMTRCFGAVPELQYSARRELLKLTKPEYKRSLAQLFKLAEQGDPLEAVKGFFDFVAKPGRTGLNAFQAFESAMKMGAWNYLRKSFPEASETEVNYMVSRFAGTPNPFTVAGFAKNVLVKSGFLFVNTIVQSQYRMYERLLENNPMYEFYVDENDHVRYRRRADNDGSRKKYSHGFEKRRKGAKVRDILMYAAPGIFFMLCRAGLISQAARKAGLAEDSETMAWINELENVARMASNSDIMGGRIPLTVDKDGKVVYIKMPTTGLTDTAAAWMIGLVGYATQNPSDPLVSTIGLGDIVLRPAESVFNKTPIVRVWGDIVNGLDANTGGSGQRSDSGLQPATGQTSSKYGLGVYNTDLAKDLFNNFTARAAGTGGFDVGARSQQKNDIEEILYGKYRFFGGLLRPFVAVSDKGFRDNKRHATNVRAEDSWLVDYAATQFVAGNSDVINEPEIAAAIAKDSKFLDKVYKRSEEKAVGDAVKWKLNILLNPK
jgi:DNA repair protein RadC